MEELLGLFNGDLDKFQSIVCQFCDELSHQTLSVTSTPNLDFSTACFQAIAPKTMTSLDAHENYEGVGSKSDAFEDDAEVDESSGLRKVKRKGWSGFVSGLVTKVKDTAKKVVEGDTRAKMAAQIAASQRIIDQIAPRYGSIISLLLVLTFLTFSHFIVKIFRLFMFIL